MTNSTPTRSEAEPAPDEPPGGPRGRDVDHPAPRAREATLEPPGGSGRNLGRPAPRAHEPPGGPRGRDLDHPAPRAHEAHVDLPDGRRLAYTTYGADTGPLVVVLDGPASRGLARAASAIAAQLGIRLVAPDRPGAGRSTPAPGRTIADWPSDHAALLDALGADRAGILAQSGGTPYAIAAAARLPDRTIAFASLGPIAPFDDPASVRELGGELRAGVKLARRAPWLLRALLRNLGRDPQKAARKFAKDVPAADARILEDPSYRAIHEQGTAEILAQPDAIAREIGLMARPWGVDPADVGVPVSFWSGSHDTRHPTAQARRLAASIPGDPPVHVVDDAATFGLLPIYADALRFATAT